MTKSRGINKPAKRWTVADLATLRRLYPDTVTKDIAVQIGRELAGVYRQAAQLGLHKSEAFRASDLSGRILRGKQSERMKATQFKPGTVPANKGLRRPGWAPGRMASTQFRRGVRQGVAVKLYKPIGTERLSKDGYREVKIHDGMPLQSRWRALHLVEWEKINGRIPRGHALAFRDRNKANVAPENMELITHAELMRRNTLHRYPKPIANAIQLRGALVRKINRRTRNEKQDGGSPQSPVRGA